MTTLAQSCINGHPYTADNTYVRPSGKRNCRKCAAFHSLQYKRRIREAGGKVWQSSNAVKRRWEREVRDGIRLPRQRKRRRFLPVLEVLEHEGGWWTIEGLAMRLGAKEDSVNRSLSRLKKRGLVESRTIPRWEWRAL